MDLNRRHLLGALAALPLSGPLAACAALPTLPGLEGHPYKQIGVQLYTVRDAFSQDPEGTLGRIRAAGFDEVEFINFGGTTPGAFKTMIRNAGLQAPSGHVGLNDLKTRPEAAFDDMAAAGATYAILAWLPEESRKDWRETATAMNNWGSLAKSRGLKFGYHNHDFEFKKTAEGEMPFHLLLDNTDPDAVCFELDCYWASFAGHDPLHVLSEHGDRIRQLHLKDKLASGEMTSVGQGVIDFPAILKKAKTVGVEHVYVEHDNPTDAFTSITASIKALKA